MSPVGLTWAVQSGFRQRRGPEVMARATAGPICLSSRVSVGEKQKQREPGRDTWEGMKAQEKLGCVPEVSRPQGQRQLWRPRDLTPDPQTGSLHTGSSWRSGPGWGWAAVFCTQSQGTWNATSVRSHCYRCGGKAPRTQTRGCERAACREAESRTSRKAAPAHTRPGARPRPRPRSHRALRDN